MADLAVPERDEVLGREARARVLVDRHAVQARSRLRRDDHERYARIDARQDADTLALARDEHDRLDALEREPVHGLAQHVGVERAHARLRHGVPGRVRRLVEAEGGVRRPVVGAPRLDEPDRARTTPGHRPGGRRWRVVELGDRLLHAQPRRRGHAGEVVEHARHGLVRDAGPAGDVEHGGYAGGLPDVGSLEGHGRPAGPLRRLVGVLRLRRRARRLGGLVWPARGIRRAHAASLRAPAPGGSRPGSSALRAGSLGGWSPRR